MGEKAPSGGADAGHAFGTSCVGTSSRLSDWRGSGGGGPTALLIAWVCGMYISNRTPLSYTGLLENCAASASHWLRA